MVKIFGVPRQYEGNIHCMIYDISSVSNLNELTHHLLEVTYLRLQRTRGSLQVSFKIF